MQSLSECSPRVEEDIEGCSQFVQELAAERQGQANSCQDYIAVELLHHKVRVLHQQLKVLTSVLAAVDVDLSRS